MLSCKLTLKVFINTLFFSVVGLSQTTVPTTVQVTEIANITSSSTIIDNRSTFTAKNTIHTFCAAGSGSWSVTIQYSDTASTGPWTNFSDGAASVSNASVLSTCGQSTGAIGGGTGYHEFIRFNISGTVSVSYSGQKTLWFPFPLPIGSSTTFGSISSGVNTTAAMVVGSGASLSFSGSGYINSNYISGVNLAGLSTGILKLTAGVPSIAIPGTDFLLPSNNLSDVSSPATARANLGITQANIAALWTGAGCSGVNALLFNGSCGTLGLPSGSQTQYLQLTPNSGAIPAYQWNSLNSVNPYDYNYSITPSSPSTITGASGSQVITLPICPLGIYSGGTWAAVYLTAGSGGAAEVVTPSGGSCSGATLGVSSGTIIISPANNHGAGYAVTSSTAGFQEAALAQPTKTITFSGSVNWVTGVSLPTGHPGISGVGPSAQIILQYNSGNGITVNAGPYPSRFANFQIYPSSGIMTSGALIYNSNNGGQMIVENSTIGQSSTRDSYIGIQSASSLSTSNVRVYARYRAISASNTIDLRSTVVTGTATTGNYLTGSAALYLSYQTGGDVKSFISANNVFQYGWLIDNTSSPVNELQVSDLYLDSWHDYGVYIAAGNTNDVRSWEIANARLIDNSGNNNGVCLQTTNAVIQWNIVNLQCGYWSAGVVLRGASYVNISGSSIFPEGTSSNGPYGQGPVALALDTGANNIKIGHNWIGSGSEGGAVSKYGIVDNNSGSGGSTYVDIFANNIQGSQNNILFDNNGPGTGWNVWSNTGVDDVWGTITSSSTIYLGPLGWYTREYITGTTTVSAINLNPGSATPQSGRSITFVKSDSGILTIGGSAQIPGTYSLGQHNQLTLVYDGVAGVWNGTPSTVGAGTGSVTSVATTCGVTGGPITLTGTVSGSEVENAQSGTSYTVAAGDCGKLVSFSNSSAVAVTLTSPATLGNGWYADLVNLGAGAVTITPASGNINGNATQTLTAGQGGHLESNGTNFRMVLGVGGGGSGSGPVFCNDASGSTTAYTCPSATLSSYTGATIIFTPQTTNTGAATVNVAGLGAKSLIYNDGGAYASGGLQGGLPYVFAYNGTAFVVPVARVVPGSSNLLIYSPGANPPTLDANTAAGALCATASACDWTGANSFSLAIANGVGSTIASASTIAPTAPITPVSGTATISTITPPGSFTASGFGGCMEFIAASGASWTLTTGGNIAAALAAVTPLAHYNGCYSNSAGLWYFGPTSGGGSAPFTNVQGDTGNIAQTGSAVTIYSVSIPALASGACMPINFHLTLGTAATTMQILIDSTVVGTPYTSFSAGPYEFLGNFTFCNTTGSQTSQIGFYQNVSFYGTGGTTPTSLICSNTDTCITNVTASINMATTHTLTLKTTAASGNTVGRFFHLSTQ